MSEAVEVMNKEGLMQPIDIDPFLRKALIMGTPALVQSIMMMPDSFVMPGFTLVALAEDVVCEPGMLYDAEKGTFSAYEPSEEIITPEVETVNEPVMDVEPFKPEPEKEPEDIVNVDDTDPLSVGGDEATE